MITLTATINLLSGNNSNLSGTANYSEYKSNISSEFSKIVGQKKKSSNPFILGAIFSTVVKYT